MKNIQPYIDIGFHTVPMNGTLERLPDGTKTVPMLPQGWNKTYTLEANTKATALGGAITGKVSNFVAIDCDETAAFNLFKQVDPDYPFVFLSKDKLKDGVLQECGTFIYAYEDDLPDSFNATSYALDFLSDNRMIYLATEANHTKHSLALQTAEELRAALKPMPPAAKLFLHGLAPKSSKQHAPIAQIARPLVQLVKQFVETGILSPQLAKPLTPKSFRSGEAYIAKGYIVPDDVPQGMGSDYLAKVSAILGSDPSISSDMYTKAMTSLNSLWARPMDIVALNATIISPMVSGRASIEGVQIWRYDPDALATRLMYSARGSDFEVVYDSLAKMYVELNLDAATAHYFRSTNATLEHLMPMGGTRLIGLFKELREKELIANVELISDPALPTGYVNGGFNTFSRNMYLEVIADPTAYKGTRPNAALALFNNLFPEEPIKLAMLQFLKYKLTTFKHTVPIIYLIGAGGTGKSLFAELLCNLVGKESFTILEVDSLTNARNEGIANALFGHLDELGDKAPSRAEQVKALGALKALSGASSFRERVMYGSPVDRQHRMTFILTSNYNNLMLDNDERRFVVLHSANKLAEQDWIANQYGSTAAFVDQLRSKEELLNFAYYLATEVEMPTADAIANMRVRLEKFESVKMHTESATAEAKNFLDKITYWIKTQNATELVRAMVDTGEEHDFFDVTLKLGTTVNRDYVPMPVLQNLVRYYVDIQPAVISRKITSTCGMKPKNIRVPNEVKCLYSIKITGICDAITAWQKQAEADLYEGDTDVQ